MTQTHLHLLITHLPIFGSVFGGLLLGYGLWVKSNHTILSAYFLLIISTIGSVIAYLTGEEASELVEKIPGINKALIETHEEFALVALVSLIILGTASLLGVFLTLKNTLISRTFATVTLVASFISFGLIARTGYLGGQIRHTEISSAVTNPTYQTEKDNDD
ncbi:MAG: hypothetical protein NTZ19_05725 [Bacteroidetes bacterium]|nr:hypothetical protein [Bacteroidota bacterium]